MIFIGDLKPYCLQLDTSRAMQYKRLLEQADRYKQMELPLEHPKESTTYMGIAIANLALAYRLSGSEQYLQDAKRFMNTVLSYEKWGNAHLVNVDLSASWILFGLSLGYDWLKPYLSEEEKQRILAEFGIRVNMVSPGTIDTPFHAATDRKLVESWKDSILMKRLGEPREVADVIEFLASDKASFLTGEVIQINGGQAFI